MRRANTSMTKATYNQPCQVETYEVADSQLVRLLRPELAGDPVQRTWRLGITDRGSHDLATHHAASPSLRINRSTVQRATVTPS